MFRLKNWSVVSTIDNKKRLSGNIFNHPTIKDGTEVITSSINFSIGRLIYTSSGSHYYLEGLPEFDYLEWLNKNGHSYNEENPVQVLNINYVKLKYWNICNNSKILC